MSEQSPLVEVDVGPAEAEHLVAAHPGHGGEPQRREQPVTGGGPQERLQLLGRPGLLSLDADASTSLRIEGVEGLVEQHQRGAAHEGAGHGDPLPLADRELRGSTIGQSRRHFEKIEHLGHPGRPGAPVALPSGQAESDVRADVAVLQERGALGYRRDRSLGRSQVDPIVEHDPAGDLDRSGVGGLVRR